MLLSMTGYGKAEAHYKGKKIYAEIKSLNSKALDVSTRLALLYRDKDMTIRKLIASQLERGKVDFNLWVETETASLTSPINPEAVSKYVNQIHEISKANSLSFPDDSIWEVLIKLPDTTSNTATEELDEAEWQAAQEAIAAAIGQLIEFRQQEGLALFKKFSEKVDNIEHLLSQIEPYEKARVEKVKTRLTERLAELTGVDYDRNRLEQELIYYIEKLDINEEKQRLTNHLKYFRETLADGHGQGKKLGFIAQEMGREINTMGSKSNQAEMQNIVVKMKDELEQIKEQVLNVL